MSVDVRPNVTADIDEHTKDRYERNILEERAYIARLEGFYTAELLEPILAEDFPPFLEQPLEYFKSILHLSTHPSNLHRYVNEFLSTEKPDSTIRRKTITAYWDFLENIIKKDIKAFTLELRYLLRFGLLVTSAVAPQILQQIKDFHFLAHKDVSIYYLDEWLLNVSEAKLNQSVVDETAISSEGQLAIQQGRLKQLTLQKEQLIASAVEVGNSIDKTFNTMLKNINYLQSREMTNYDFLMPLNPLQYKTLLSMKELVNNIQTYNQTLESKLAGIKTNELTKEKISHDIQMITVQSGTTLKVDFSEKKSKKDKKKKNQNEPTTFDYNTQIVSEELRATRQMIKMCIGSRGNHFPILFHNYFSGPIQSMGTKEQVLKIMHKIESIDFSLFKKKVRDTTIRTFPIILLAPCYGTNGICWEPYEKLNKNGSSPKIAIPMYSRNLETAVIRALGDFRWQFAKEAAGHLWMEEGLSGYYFQWFDSHIGKGNIKEQFIEHYTAWIKWESTGVQKLESEVRSLFWRFIPFNTELKNLLAHRSSIYKAELTKDKNRALAL